MQSKSEHFFFRMQHFHMSGCSRSADTQQIIFKMFIFHRYCVINSCLEMQRRKNRIDKLSWIIKTTTTFFNLHFRLLVWCLLMMLTLILLLFFCFYFCSAPIAQQNCIFKRMKILTYAHGSIWCSSKSIQSNGHGFPLHFKRYIQIKHRRKKWSRITFE